MLHINLIISFSKSAYRKLIFISKFTYFYPPLLACCACSGDMFMARSLPVEMALWSTRLALAETDPESVHRSF